MINNNNDNNNNMKVLSLLSDILAVYFIIPEAFSEHRRTSRLKLPLRCLNSF